MSRRCTSRSMALEPGSCVVGEARQLLLLAAQHALHAGAQAEDN